MIWHNGAPEDDTAIYTAPPAPAVNAAPDFEVWFNSPEAGLRVVNYHIQHELQLKAWNACRAAMLENIYKPALQLDSVVTRHSDQPVSSGYTLPDGWIACSEQMPDNDETKPIAIYTGKCLGQGMFVATYDEDGIFDYWEGGEIIGVTHWMPLPAAPGGGN